MFHIGILQLTQNLDDAVKGFREGIAAQNLAVDFTYENADGNQAELPKLAQRLAAQNADLIFACSTPSAKAALSLEGQIPVVFTPVFDPVTAGLVDKMDRPGGKATGMSGMVPAEDKINFIQSLLPAAKNLALLFPTKDPNARIETENMRLAAAGRLTFQPIELSCQEDISLLEEKLPLDTDALFLPIGRILEENFASIVYYADARNLPIIASHAPNVSAGALGALVADHELLGYQCAIQAGQILSEGKNPAELPVGITQKPQILLNAYAAENLGITLPEELKKAAKEIYR